MIDCEEVKIVNHGRIVRAEDDEEHDEDGDNKVCRKGIKTVIMRRMCVRSMRMAMVIGMRMKLRMVTIRCVRKGMDIGQWLREIRGWQ